MPWYSNEINLDKNIQICCCHIDKSKFENLGKLKADFLAGKQPVACGKCWNSENDGIESKRQMENRFLDYKLDRDLSYLIQDVYDGKNKTTMLQLYVGSICNGTCVTCGYRASSAWKTLNNKPINIKNEKNTVYTNCINFLQQYDLSIIERINFLGGEPLLIKETYLILEELKNKGNIDCHISYVTNGSVQLSEKQIMMFRQFKNVNCCVSIDGMKEEFEYIRFPLKWANVVENILTYKEVFNEVTASFTISNLNYHNRSKIINWFNDNNIRYFENYVTLPQYFNYKVDPLHELWDDFVDEIKHQDELKGISIKDYIPEIASKIYDGI